MAEPLKGFKNPDLTSSFTFAWHGLVSFTQISRRNTWIMVAFGGGALLLGLALRIPTTELALVVLGIAVVAVAEMVNTSLEAVVDLVTPEWHPQAKIAKDVAAAAVLVAIVAAFAVGLLVFVPHLMGLLR